MNNNILQQSDIDLLIFYFITDIAALAKRIENVAINRVNLWWRECESLEEPIFCNYYGRMKAYTRQNSSLMYH